ncbi:uncharacterized protein DNG_04245 [Cephalotrichum gorgonifer]|uniref:Ipa protein n=1 Tax=Cephalotrichum gorgonifer TaxID=2041049 RepID=A0AAE8SUC6_9PEZI|nr:uncharacterized protein DNG_04245 [Cephalotrichum gorgonifer]
MDQATSPDMLKELQSDLARKYAKHGPAIEEFWRSFDGVKRATCMKAGTPDGVVLEHSMDRALGNVCKFIPEWNLRDTAYSGPEPLLAMLKRRATTSLLDQYHDDPTTGRPGDANVILDMMERRNLCHANPFKDSYSLFMDNEQYGVSYTIPGPNRDEILKGFTTAMQAGAFIPQSTGELIMLRQLYLLQSLNIIVEDILEQGSLTRTKKKNVKKPDQAVTAALSKLSIQAQTKATLPDLIASASDQKDTLEEYLSLLTTEPVVLAHAVNAYFFSRPELIPDEKGRTLPAHTDKYISAAFFETIHDAIQAATIWNYLNRLLELFQQTPAGDKVFRSTILQEVSNVCHMEYARAQALFKRHVQTGTGSKWFQRTSNAFDKAGNPRVGMKGKAKPEDLTRSNPQLHYMLRLCQSETTPAKAIEWIRKLAELHEAHPSQREQLFEREVDALSDLVVIATFIQGLSAIAAPPLSRKLGQSFISHSGRLKAEMNALKKDVDLRDFVVPIDNLLEPGVAQGALKALELFVADKSGTKMGLLYYDVIDECIADIHARYQEAKAKLEQQKQKQKEGTANIPHFPPTSEPTPKFEQPVTQQKDKTRPLESTTYELAPEQPAPESPAPPLPTFKVSSATADVFSALFDRSQSRGSVAWSAFESAMAELGFSVVPKFGSVYTFLPPGALAVKRSLTLHRPHGSQIEGFRVLIFAKRLRRVYGWGEGTFTEK